MAGWVAAGVLLLVAALLAWRLGAAHRQSLELRRELAAAQRDLESTLQAEQSLHDWQTSVGSAVEEALLTLDTEQHVVWANEKSVRLFGASTGKSLIEATRLYDLEMLVADTCRSTEPMERLVTLNGSTYFGPHGAAWRERPGAGPARR